MQQAKRYRTAKEWDEYGRECLKAYDERVKQEKEARWKRVEECIDEKVAEFANQTAQAPRNYIAGGGEDLQMLTTFTFDEHEFTEFHDEIIDYIRDKHHLDCYDYSDNCVSAIFFFTEASETPESPSASPHPASGKENEASVSHQ